MRDYVMKYLTVCGAAHQQSWPADVAISRNRYDAASRATRIDERADFCKLITNQQHSCEQAGINYLQTDCYNCGPSPQS